MNDPFVDDELSDIPCAELIALAKHWNESSKTAGLFRDDFNIGVEYAYQMAADDLLELINR